MGFDALKYLKLGDISLSCWCSARMIDALLRKKEGNVNKSFPMWPELFLKSFMVSLYCLRPSYSSSTTEYET